MGSTLEAAVPGPGCSPCGKRLGIASHEIQIWREGSDFVEQSSEDIWQAVCAAVRGAIAQSGIDPSEVAGIGFDATCSLVVLDADGSPLPVGPHGDKERNVIMWMDHRASEEAAEINQLDEEVLRYVGGRISIEMQVPKLLWLKRNLPKTWSQATNFFDLPDYLTYRATGSKERSLCSTVCKWTYLGHKGNGNESGWDRGFFQRIGLEDLLDYDCRRIGSEIRPLGGSIGSGLTAKAAKELGLSAGVAVGVSVIDAHAGGIALLGLSGHEKKEIRKAVALIGGTSSCHMAVASDPIFAKGIWGPYYSAMLPGFWLNEGGQSATGVLVDHIVFRHSAADELRALSKAAGKTPYEYLNHLLSEQSSALDHTNPDQLTADLHVYPDFHGNRSPYADPGLRGMISGLSMENTVNELARLYLATIQAIAYGTRQIIGVLNDSSYGINSICASGGGIKNPVFIRAHANATGYPIILPEEPEAMILGAALLGAVAAGTYPTIDTAMKAMCRRGSVIEPQRDTIPYHDRKYEVFQRLHSDQLAYRRLVSGV